jgi:ABC-type cobalamin/Fe3+-siderophores transport system ATPase subunit
MATLKGIAVSGALVIFSTHDLDHAMQFADDIVLLSKDGLLVSFGKPTDAFSAKNLIKIFGLQPVDYTIKGKMAFERVIDNEK